MCFSNAGKKKRRRPKASNSTEKHFVSLSFFVVVVGCSFKTRKGPRIKLSASERKPFLTFRRRDPKCQRAKRLSLISGLKLPASAQPAAPPQSEKCPTRTKVTRSVCCCCCCCYSRRFPSRTLFFFNYKGDIKKREGEREKSAAGLMHKGQST